jgi:hypothetical protein
MVSGPVEHVSPGQFRDVHWIGHSLSNGQAEIKLSGIAQVNFENKEELGLREQLTLTVRLDRATHNLQLPDPRPGKVWAFPLTHWLIYASPSYAQSEAAVNANTVPPRVGAGINGFSLLRDELPPYSEPSTPLGQPPAPPTTDISLQVNLQILGFMNLVFVAYYLDLIVTPTQWTAGPPVPHT